MSERVGPRAIVAGHGDFGVAMVDVVRRITGDANALRAVSGQGLDAGGIERAIRAAAEELGAHVVFTDLPAGSCTTAARRVARETPGLVVVTGASVPMLLDYLLGEGTGVEALQRAAERARDAILVFGGREGRDVH
ncbi:MAG: hypothetical protein IT356_04935 [Gemmatimonadaceae bacterium]|nr:hypothetical protein [Gemmatimonadaceae bacterium]